MTEYSIVGYALQLGAVVRSCVDVATGVVLDWGVSYNPVTGDDRRKAAGLSTAHKPTLQPRITGWIGGTLVKVEREPGLKREQKGGGQRGEIQEFSRTSRRRFQRMMATVQKENLPIFVTLTYPDEFPDDLHTWNLHLERLRSRLRRKGWGVIWRREFKERQSGDNAGKVAPHYHLLVWGASQAAIRAYIPGAWYEVVGSGDPRHLEAGTRVEILRTWRGVCGYVSKYMAKSEELPEMENIASVGRFWGVINRDGIPWAEAIEMTLDYKTVNTFFRYLRRYAHLRARGSWPSLTVFVDDPWRWLEATTR